MDQVTDPSLDLQQAVRARLVTSPAVTALVPVSSIFDRSRRPEAFPCVILGEGQTVNEALTYGRQHVRCYLDVHIWTHADALSSVKAISGPVVAALRGERLALGGAYCIDQLISHVRFMRDPAGEHAHAVVTLETLIELEPTL